MWLRNKSSAVNADSEIFFFLNLRAASVAGRGRRLVFRTSIFVLMEPFKAPIVRRGGGEMIFFFPGVPGNLTFRCLVNRNYDGCRGFFR